MTRKEPCADENCGDLLDQFQAQGFRSFGIYGANDLGAQSFLAINCHHETLTKLELLSLNPDAVPHLSKIKDCTKLTFLALAELGAPTVDLETRHNDVFLELIAWLRRCKNLKKIHFSTFYSATALLTPFLREPGLELAHLVLDSYMMSESREFHQALALQTKLRSLQLNGEDSEAISDNDVLVESLSKLSNLVELKVLRISANFSEHHIRTLALSLKKLESFWTSGFHITDNILPDIAKLERLKELDFNADTRFTADGIMDFILSLGAGNRGLVLSVSLQDTDSDIPEREQNIIRETISSHLGGRFVFELVREVDEGGFSSEDSD